MNTSGRNHKCLSWSYFERLTLDLSTLVPSPFLPGLKSRVVECVVTYPLLVLVDGPFFGFGFDDFACCFSVDTAGVLLIASSSLLLGLRWI